MDGFVTSSAALSAGGVKLLDDAEGIAQAEHVLCLHFHDNVPEIAATLRRDEVAFKSGIGCRARSVLGCVDEAGEVQAAAVCLTKKLPVSNLLVIEIVWFGARDRGCGWGSRLFDGIMCAARGIRADAVLSSSTNGALPFWLSRPNVRIASAVLRSADRAPLIQSEAQSAHFKLVASPTSAGMERLYAEAVVRNRKGRVIGDFEGKPYYYGVATSNHVWYPLNASLRLPLAPKIVQRLQRRKSVDIKPVLVQRAQVGAGGVLSTESA